MPFTCEVCLPSEAATEFAMLAQTGTRSVENAAANTSSNVVGASVMSAKAIVLPSAFAFTRPATKILPSAKVTASI